MAFSRGWHLIVRVQAQNIDSQGSGINFSILKTAVGNQGLNPKTDDEVVNDVVRGSFVDGAGGPLPAEVTPIDYAASNGGTAADYVSFEIRPALAKDQQTALVGDCCDYFSEFISTAMMAGVMSWTTADVGGQGLVCGIALSTPAGLGNWNDFGTAVSDTGNGDNCFYGEDGDFSASEFYGSDDVFAVSREKGGGYVNWVYDPSSDSVVRDENATMVYYPPRVHSSLQGRDWEIFDETMMVVGVLMLASGWGSALGAAVTGEFLTAAAEGVLNAAFTTQMTEPLFAHEHISGGPLSYFGASRRIFYFGDNFWVRNADDTLSEVSTPSDKPDEFEAAGLDNYTLITQPAGLISNYLPLTYYTNSEKTAAATYMFEFRNGDVRRDDTSEYAMAPIAAAPSISTRPLSTGWAACWHRRSATGSRKVSPMISPVTS